MKKISVIVPCYNSEQYLEECIESIINQTIGIDKIQLILINDASGDNTINIIRDYEEKYSNSIEVIDLKENVGQGPARNMGIEKANAEYIAFVDSDDFLELDAYETLLEIAEKTNVDLVQGAIKELFSEGSNRVVSLPAEDRKYDLLLENDKEIFFVKQLMGSHCLGIFRKSIFDDKKIRYGDYRKYEDNYFMGIVAYNIKSFYLSHKVVYNYRLLLNSNSHNVNDYTHLIRLKIELDLLEYYKTSEIYDKNYKYIRRSFLEKFYNNTLHIIFCKFTEIPYDVIREMQMAVKVLFPDYLGYYSEKNEFTNMIITVAFDFNETLWGQIKRAYCDWIIKGEDDAIIKNILGMKSALSLD